MGSDNDEVARAMVLESKYKGGETNKSRVVRARLRYSPVGDRVEVVGMLKSMPRKTGTQLENSLIRL